MHTHGFIFTDRYLTKNLISDKLKVLQNHGRRAHVPQLSDKALAT